METQNSFEENLNKLEENVRQLEDGDIPLKDTLEIFEQGIRLSKQCRGELELAQTKIEKLIVKEGKVTSEPYSNQE